MNDETIEPIKKSVMDLTVSKNGDIAAKDVNELAMKFKMMIDSGMLPDRYKKASQVIVAYQYAQEVGLKGLTALKQIAIIKGTPTLYGDLPLSLVHAKKTLSSIEEFLFDKDNKKICWENKNLTNPPFGAVCITVRADNGARRETFFTTEMAKKANIYKAVWLSYTGHMLKYRARGENLKDNASDVLNNVGIGEYDFNTMNPSENPIDYNDSTNDEVNGLLENVAPIEVEVVVNGETTEKHEWPDENEFLEKHDVENKTKKEDK